MRPCARCGGKSSETWTARICAVGKKVTYRLCRKCDIDLNRAVLDFFREPDVSAIITAYAEQKGAQ